MSKKKNIPAPEVRRSYYEALLKHFKSPIFYPVNVGAVGGISGLSVTFEPRMGNDGITYNAVVIQTPTDLNESINLFETPEHHQRLISRLERSVQASYYSVDDLKPIAKKAQDDLIYYQSLYHVDEGRDFSTYYPKHYFVLVDGELVEGEAPLYEAMVVTVRDIDDAFVDIVVDSAVERNKAVKVTSICVGRDF